MALPVNQIAGWNENLQANIGFDAEACTKDDISVGYALWLNNNVHIPKMMVKDGKCKSALLKTPDA